MCDDLDGHITAQGEALKAAVPDMKFYDDVLHEELVVSWTSSTLHMN
jgi:hypothetical protein